MKIGDNFGGFNISAKGLSIQRNKMNVIAENIANADTIRDANGQPYKRKFVTVEQKPDPFNFPDIQNQSRIKLNTTSQDHISSSASLINQAPGTDQNLNGAVNEDKSKGEVVYMPDHPYADENGYVEMSNVNIITEMVEMIAATRSYEANLTALNSSKQMAKDSLEI
jgi:flagellar basal-body rod protein FlgC